jgi:DNA-binding YbaB/EbfC family protein
MFGDFKKLWELQQKAKKLQKELSKARFEESAYNGNVKVVVSGTGELLEVKINPDALKDIRSIENAIVNAVNSAIKKAMEFQREKTKEFLAELPPEYRKELEKFL